MFRHANACFSAGGAVRVWLRVVAFCAVGLGLVALRAEATGLPEVLVSRISVAERLQVPATGGGHFVYEGFYLFAGDWLAESRPLAPAAGSSIAPFEVKVRRAADREVVYTLPADSWGTRRADGALFSDGQLLAVRVRPRTGGVARLAIHDLATGAARFELTLPIWVSGLTESDDFGRAVWFTEDRILVAAPGRDRLQTDDGVIFVFERATGRYVASLSPGIKNARFGAPPAAGSRDPQPVDVPYVQVEGKRALIVHGRRAFLFADDRLRTLIIPPTGLHASRLRGALFVDNRIVLATSETLQRRSVPGRILVYESSAGRLRYQIRGSSLGASYQFAARIVAADRRLWVHDPEAGDGVTTRGALHAFDLATGRRTTGIVFPYLAGNYQDARSLAHSGDRLWLRFLQAPAGSLYYGDATTEWRAYDPATLAEIKRLVPRAGETFSGWAPQPLGEDRWAVVATGPRYANIVSSSLSPAETRRARSVDFAASVIVTGPPDIRRVLVLVHSDDTAVWTHRMELAGRLAEIDYSGSPSAYERLRFFDGASPGKIVVTRDESLVGEILDYDTTLPTIPPEAMLGARLDFIPSSGFAYDLLRRAPGAAEFTLVRSLGLGDDKPRSEPVPYADFLDAVDYRLDGLQFSRRLSDSEAVELPAASSAVSTVALSGGLVARALGQGLSFSDRPRVEVFDTEAAVTLFTATLPYSFPTAQIWLDDDYLVCGEAGYDYPGEIRFFDATTAELEFSIVGKKRFGNQFALSAGRLVASSVDSSYLSGVYTHQARLTVHELPSGSLLRTLPLGVLSDTRSWFHPSTDFVVSGDLAVVRNFADGTAFASAGRLRVLDVGTGETRYVLDAPAPAANDNYGAWLAAAGDWLAVGAPGLGEVYVYDLPTGELRHTLVLADQPGALANTFAQAPRLTIDPETNLLAWLATAPPASGGGLSLSPAPVVYLFDLNTGLEEAKLSVPASLAALPVLALAFDAGRLHVTTAAQRFTYEFADALAAPLTESLLPLSPLPRVQLDFPTRPDVTYQPEVSADAGVTWTPLGPAKVGDGRPARLFLPLDDFADPAGLIFRLAPRWSKTN